MMKSKIQMGLSLVSILLCNSGCLSETLDETSKEDFDKTLRDGDWSEDSSDHFEYPAVEITPNIAVLTRMEQDYLRNDGFIDEIEARKMLAFTKKYNGQNRDVLEYLRDLAQDTTKVTYRAQVILEEGERIGEDLQTPLHNDIYEIHTGSQDFLFDDDLYLRFNGIVDGSTGILSHSRGYAAKRDGILFKRHGSPAPHYQTTNTRQETDSLRSIGPDEALDNAAKIYGLELDNWNTFAHIARDPNYYDPSSSTPFWAGICQGWTHNALDDRINILVDVEGNEGSRGLWIFGQWISRADLGNAMMGVSYSLGIADSVTIDSFVTPENLVKALAQHVIASGTGLRVDIWNDEHNSSETYNPQIWNQPIVDASIEVQNVSTQTAQNIISYARDNVFSWSQSNDYSFVRQVTATALWGTETDDSWEKEARFKTSEWNMYLITNFEGRVLKGFMANELADAGVLELPIETSDGLPDYIAIPKHELTDAAFDDGEHYLLQPHNPEGLRFRFLVGTVLARGIPNHTRKAFENAFFVQNVSTQELLEQFPTIANAYSPEQWQEQFEPVLGSGKRFGAVWGQAEQ